MLEDDEFSIALDDNKFFLTTLYAVAVTDAMLATLHDDDARDPQSIPEAKRSKYWAEWLSAIQEELASLNAKGVYDEVRSLPPDRKPVQCKWVLHIKRDKDGTISHFKA